MTRPTDGNGSTIMVTWKTFPIVVAFVAFLIVACAGTSAQQDVAKKIFIGICGCVWGYYLIRLSMFFVRRGMIRKHPANNIADLVAAGDYEKAYKKGLELLSQYPDNASVQYNCATAMYRSGRLEEARQLFAIIQRRKLPRFLRRAYDEWQTELSS
jgi:tetratricopeptide (TPR) repeat protein